jgi:hypothetical protein
VSLEVTVRGTRGASARACGVRMWAWRRPSTISPSCAATFAVRPLGTKVLSGPGRRGRVIVPGNSFADYIFFIDGLFGHYRSSDG